MIIKSSKFIIGFISLIFRIDPIFQQHNENEIEKNMYAAKKDTIPFLFLCILFV